jgi:lipopolysaccharide export system protein LptA
MSANSATMDSTKSARGRVSAFALGAMSTGLLLVGLATSSLAQDTTGAATGGGGLGFDNNSKDPLEISADNGIEWKRDARTYTARGNALAKQGDTSIAADTLVAYLDEQDQVASWEAFGNVKIVTGQSTSYGEHAKYQESQRLLVLTGNNLKVVTTDQTVTARDQIEYWRDKDTVVAKGNVVLVQPKDNTTIHSDQATAYFHDKVDDPATPEKETGSEVYQVDAQGHVRVDRKGETAFSDQLAYTPNTQIAVLTGNVVINSKENTYRGGRAELDMKNDISRLLPTQGQRVITTIKTKSNNAAPDAGSAPAPVTQ